MSDEQLSVFCFPVSEVIVHTQMCTISFTANEWLVIAVNSLQYTVIIFTVIEIKKSEYYIVFLQQTRYTVTMKNTI